MNERDKKRDAYIYHERKKGRTLKSIGDELGIGGERVRQIYVREDRERNGTLNTDAFRRLEKKKPATAAIIRGWWETPSSFDCLPDNIIPFEMLKK